MSNIFKSSVALAISIALTACGGGGESPPKELANIAPQLANIDTLSIKEGKSVTISASASDSDGIVSSYAWTQTDGTGVELLNADSDTVSFSAPTLNEDTSITLKVTTTDDDGAIASTDVIVNVLNNRLPTIQSITPQSFNENGEFNIEAIINDEDGEVASIRWEQLSGKTITLADSDKATVSIYTPKIGQDEVGQLRLVTTDDDGEETEQLVSFNVINTHHNIILSGNANLNGTVLANSEIAFEINDQIFNSTADATGDFSIELDVELSNENYTYQIKATGTDSQSNINLSRTALFNEIMLSSQNTETQPQAKVKKTKPRSLVTTSSSSKNNANDDVPNVSADINALTTSESEYLVSLFGNEKFANTEYVDSKEFNKKYKNIDAQLLLEIAAALSYAAQNNEQIQTDNGLVGITEYLVILYADDEGKVLFDQLLTAQKNNNNKDVEKLLDLDTRYYGTLAAASGTVRKGIPFQQSYLFNSDGQYQQTQQSSVKTALWQYTDGEIVIDTSAWPEQQGASIWSEDVSDWLECTYKPIRQKFNVLSSWKNGSKKSILTKTNTVVCTYNDVELENFVGDDETYLTLFNLEDLEAWQEQDLANQSFIFEHYSESAIVDYKNLDSLTRAMEYQFSDNGTGVVVEDNNAAFTWIIDSDGQLQMTFDSGYTITWLKMYDDRSDRMGGASVFALYNKGATFYQYQDMAVTVNRPTWKIEDFIGKLDHSFTVSQPKYNAFIDGFFFELNEDGTGGKNRTSADGLTITRTIPTRWYDEGDKIVMVVTYTWDDIKGADWSNCDFKIDANCYLYEYRTWEMVLKHGQRYYVKETLSIDNQLWNRGAPSSDLNDFYITERTNFYQPFRKGNN